MFLGSFRRNPSVVKRENCDITPKTEETMENFTRETKKALWHVYDMLNTTNSSDVHISQLKVITSNIGRILGFDSSEHLLDRDGMTTMDFDTYFDIIKTDLIIKQKTVSDCTLKPLGERLTDVMKTCWTFCRYERTHKSKAMDSDHCLVLWRLFNFFCETTEDGEIALPIVLHKDEAAFICKEFIEVTGQKNKETAVNEIANATDDGNECLKFGDFQNLFEMYFLEGLSPSAVSYGLNQLYDKFVLEILATGMMWKRGFNVKNWKERFLVLSTRDLKYYVSQSQKHLKGTIEFDKECEIEIPPEKAGHKPNRFVLHTSKKPYEMSASDLKSKHEWVSAFQTAIGQVGKETNIYQEAARERCLARFEKKRQLEEEAKKRKEEVELLAARQRELDEEKRKRLEDEALLQTRLGELEEEKRLRALAEARAREEQLLREAEQERLKELEAIKKELERLLAEERQAKKDEEIVRALQAKLLQEEFEKREELERLKQQQDEILARERDEKASLQSDREEQERLLREAKEKLEQLERDRIAAATKMQEAAEKLQKAENDRRIMEDKVKLWKTPVGLARPIVPTVNPHVTHRGRGAFCELDFVKISKDTPVKKEGEKPIGDPEEDHSDKKLPKDKVDIKRDEEQKDKNSLAGEINLSVEEQKSHERGEEQKEKNSLADERNLTIEEQKSHEISGSESLNSGEKEKHVQTEGDNEQLNVHDEPVSNANGFDNFQSKDRFDKNEKESEVLIETEHKRDVLLNRNETERASNSEAERQSNENPLGQRIFENQTDISVGTNDTQSDQSVMKTQSDNGSTHGANDSSNEESDNENESSDMSKQEQDETLQAFDNPIYDTV